MSKSAVAVALMPVARRGPKLVKFCVGSVTYRGAHPSFAVSMLRLSGEPTFAAFLHRRGDWMLERARSIVASHFLTDTSADVLLWIDSDIVFDPNQAVELCDQAMDFSVIGGLYMMRHDVRVAPAARVQEPMLLEGRPRPVRTEWVGTGFLATHRRVYEALLQRDDVAPVKSADDEVFWPFFYPFMPELEGSTYWLGEDVSFCHRSREAGFEVYVNPAIPVTHMGSREYRLEDMVPHTMPGTPKRITPYDDETGERRFRLELRPISEPVMASSVVELGAANREGSPR